MNNVLSTKTSKEKSTDIFSTLLFKYEHDTKKVNKRATMKEDESA